MTDKARYRVRARRRFLSPVGATLDGALAPNVALFTKVSPQPYDPNIMLAKAMNADLTEVVIVGFDGDGDFFFASSKASGGDCAWLLNMGLHKLMTVYEELGVNDGTG